MEATIRCLCMMTKVRKFEPLQQSHRRIETRHWSHKSSYHRQTAQQLGTGKHRSSVNNDVTRQQCEAVSKCHETRPSLHNLYHVNSSRNRLPCCIIHCATAHGQSKRSQLLYRHRNILFKDIRWLCNSQKAVCLICISVSNISHALFALNSPQATHEQHS